jgi:hypothetical protein
MVSILHMAATFLVFYRFKTMTPEETKKANEQWKDIKKSLPPGIELMGEYNHAWGTEYNGFLLFEADSSDDFMDWWAKFKDGIRWYVDHTHTITARRK